MNGPDKHHMECVEMDDGGYVMCFGCEAKGEGLKWRPAGECPTPWLTREQLLDRIAYLEYALTIQADNRKPIGEQQP